MISRGFWIIGEGTAHVRSYHLYAGFGGVLCELLLGGGGGVVGSTGGTIGWLNLRGGEFECLGDMSNAGMVDKNWTSQASEPG